MKNVFHFVFSLLFLIVAPLSIVAQQAMSPQLVDKVVAVIGGKIILQSEVVERTQEYMNEKVADTNGIRCKVIEDLMYEKLLLIEAEKDSTIIITDAQVEQEFDKRMSYYISQLGSKEAFEKWYGKSVEQYKEELKPDVRDLLMAQQMRGKVIDNLTVSPEDVRKYYEGIPKDSIPGVNAQEEIAQITKMPALTTEEKQVARQKCEELRERVLKGEDMGPLAILYSEDPGSAPKGGVYKNVHRKEFDPEFEKVAYSLKDSEVS
ncbi:MAG TPA: peptidylprolyl isomerase, partial [Bacteroidia bacterium]|nr:peptidylprolyl isomerase [Bacteroidia bacterium]